MLRDIEDSHASLEGWENGEQSQPLLEDVDSWNIIYIITSELWRANEAVGGWLCTRMPGITPTSICRY